MPAQRPESHYRRSRLSCIVLLRFAWFLIELCYLISHFETLKLSSKRVFFSVVAELLPIPVIASLLRERRAVPFARRHALTAYDSDPGYWRGIANSEAIQVTAVADENLRAISCINCSYH